MSTVIPCLRDTLLNITNMGWEPKDLKPADIDSAGDIAKELTTEIPFDILKVWQNPQATTTDAQIVNWAIRLLKIQVDPEKANDDKVKEENLELIKSKLASQKVFCSNKQSVIVKVWDNLRVTFQTKEDTEKAKDLKFLAQLGCIRLLNLPKN